MRSRELLIALAGLVTLAILATAPAAMGATMSEGKHRVIRASGDAPSATAAKEISKKKLVKTTVTTPVSFSSGSAWPRPPSAHRSPTPPAVGSMSARS